jgi:uncharacterized repeat protein (TIGR03803 family)
LGKLNWWNSVCIVFLLCAATATALPAQTFTSLYTFGNADGANPLGGLVLNTDGNLYGTTTYGGIYSDGSVFRITPTGALTLMYSFCPQKGCAQGSNPYAGLVPAVNSSLLYGTSASGGANGLGSIFTVSATGQLTTLFSFTALSGHQPYAGLIQASDGNFYGTTHLGGTQTDGAVIKITPTGTLTTLYSFCSVPNCTDGKWPWAGLVQASDGNLYGTTNEGGAYGAGTVYQITTSGALTTIYSFCASAGCPDGAYSENALVQGTDGNLYGTTQNGGGFGGNQGAGTVYQLTLGGTLTTLHSFCAQAGCPDGTFPRAGLIQATDGNLYGTTVNGGVGGGGTLFQVTTTGSFTTLYSFCSQPGCTDGANPIAELIQSTDGSFYGTTYFGGAGYGTVFNLSMGLGQFVEAQPYAGKVGAAVKIVGNNLTGATKVTFNGKPAKFKVNSNTQITASVPTGASTGNVQVVAPGGTLTSNLAFAVVQ